MHRRQPLTGSWSCGPRPAPALPPAAGRKPRGKGQPGGTGGLAPGPTLAPETGPRVPLRPWLRSTPGGARPRPSTGGPPVTVPAVRREQRGGRPRTGVRSGGETPGAEARGGPGHAQEAPAAPPASATEAGERRGDSRGPGPVGETALHPAAWRGPGGTGTSGRGAESGQTRRSAQPGPAREGSGGPGRPAQSTGRGSPGSPDPERSGPAPRRGRERLGRLPLCPLHRGS